MNREEWNYKGEKNILAESSYGKIHGRLLRIERKIWGSLVTDC